MEQTRRFIQKLVCFPIKLYQYLISPLMMPCCRFYPSCSQYALQAITHFGVIKGLWLTSRRLIRCQPWAKGGYDPLLTNKEKP